MNVFILCLCLAKVHAALPNTAAGVAVLVVGGGGGRRGGVTGWYMYWGRRTSMPAVAKAQQ